MDAMLTGIAVTFGLPAIVFGLSAYTAPRMRDRAYTLTGIGVSLAVLAALILGAPVVFGGAA